MKFVILIALAIFVSGCTSLEDLPDDIDISFPDDVTSTTSNTVTSSTTITTVDSVDATTIEIANWNLQIFGKSKAGKPELMEFYSDVMSDYDIIFVQEIRDASQTAFPELCSLMEGYQCNASSRAGRSSSKEQYGVIYKNGVDIVKWNDFNPDAGDRWERPPLEVTFNINGYELTVYNIHTKPDDVQEELSALEDVVSNEGNVMVFGDLNADCSYYKPEEDVEFDDWEWIISDDTDTTVSATDCAYDRIIMNDDLYQEYLSHEVLIEGIDKSVSDHYLISTEITIGRQEVDEVDIITGKIIEKDLP